MHCQHLYRSLRRKRPRPWLFRAASSRNVGIEWPQSIFDAASWRRSSPWLVRMAHWSQQAISFRAKHLPVATFSTMQSHNDEQQEYDSTIDGPVSNRQTLTSATSPLDDVANDLFAMVQEILSFHDAMAGEDDERKQQHQEPRRRIRERWSKNLILAQRFAGTIDTRSLATDVSEINTSRNDKSSEHRNQLSCRDSGAFQSSRTMQPELAVYHALKNDFQAGGDVEGIVQLETKSDVAPFAELDMLLDNIEVLEASLDKGGDVTLSKNDDDPWTAANSASSSMNLPCNPQPEEDVIRYSPNEPSAVNIGNFKKGELYRTDEAKRALLMQATDSEGTLNMQNPMSPLHMELRFKSLAMIDLENVAQISQWEQSRRDAVTHALVLLRTLNESEWRAFDYPSDVEDQENDTAVEGFSGKTYDHTITGQTNSAISDEENDSPFAETIPAIANLLVLARKGNVQFSTEDCNYILARIAVATDCLPDDSLLLIRNHYHQMMDLSRAGFDCHPNASTYEILLLVLTRRFRAFQPTLDLVVSFLESPSFTWTPKTLEATMQLCERKKLQALSQRILKHLESGAGADVDIPKRVYKSFINVMKSDDARVGVVAVLKLALKRTSHRHDEMLDSVFINAIRWPTQNRHSKTIDNKSVLRDILGALEEEKVYAAGALVWKQMIVSCASGAKDDQSRWDFVVRAFQCLSTAHPTYWPDHLLLKHGLAASEALHNAKLASNLIWRSVEFYSIPHSVSAGYGSSPAVVKGPRLSPMYIRPNVAYQDIVKALTICLSAMDMISCAEILQCATKLDLTPDHLSSLYLLCVKGYASVGDASGAEKLFVTMVKKGIQPGEEFYGALLHAYGVSNQLDNARSLLESLESGAEGLVRPGSSCYDGYILGCVCCQSWDDAIAAYESMKKARIVPSPGACHGILLAHSRRGGRRDAMTCLQDFVTAGARLRVDGVLLALTIFIPELARQPVNTENVRHYLRALSDMDATLKAESLNVIRSLRIAEVAEQRAETPGLRESVVLARRKDAYDALLRDIVSFVAAIESLQ